MTKPKSKTGFDVWFEAQYGELPLSTAEVEALEDLRDNTSRDLQRATTALFDHNELQTRYTAALYAWNISDEQKKETWT